MLKWIVRGSYQQESHGKAHKLANIHHEHPDESRQPNAQVTELQFIRAYMNKDQSYRPTCVAEFAVSRHK